MGKRIYLTESQFNTLMEQQILDESFKGVLAKVAIGALTVAGAISIIRGEENLSQEQEQEMEAQVIEAAPKEAWRPLGDDFTVTVYNAKKSQCNDDVGHTASMFKLNLTHPESHKIVAIERKMLGEFGLKYGDIIKVEGTYKGLQDGIYQIQDLTNKRFGDPNSSDYCPHKIDVLVKNSLSYGGTWPGETAKVWVLDDESQADTYRLDMAPEFNGNQQI